MANNTAQEAKFKEMIKNYYVGQIGDFRHTLKRLERSQLLRFCVYCAIHEHRKLDIFEIEKHFNS